jgi:hypothetical protein
LTRGAAAAVVAAGLALVPAVAGVTRARAHEMRPALLSLTEVEPDTYDVLWQAPVELTVLLGPVPVFPAGAERMGEEERTRVRDMEVQRFSVRIPGGVAGRRLGLRTTGPGEIEAVVRIAARDGEIRVGRLTSGAGGWTVPVAPSGRAVAGTYFRLGAMHVLRRLEPLAFLLALVFLARGRRDLWKTVAAYTVTHSLALVAASLRPVPVPALPLEAMCAVTILLVARETALAARAQRTPGWRRPWVVVSVFGLVRGLAFARALADVGLPAADRGLALASFNGGLEAVQLPFVALAVVICRQVGRAAPGRAPWLRLLPTYALGTLAAFWCSARIAAFWL